ncbi:hypothetical protein RTBOTA2_005978 [Rhodotorula toruloides]|uniref:Uncharacterized protein n=2 Tax=Rhodotorula toruloides TaxID=5286 RepID=A0A2S9ZYY4_RHOTO|nr:hypothetical protein RTBOTA2_005978 [Rhodotorula toruloides]PRQ70954.1 hypothetical protein AAT19DRAFT_10494 [Rhodotorula toruloides]
MQPTLDATILLRAPRNIPSYRMPIQAESAAPSTASSHPSEEPDDAYEPSYASSQSSHSRYPSTAGAPEPPPSSTSNHHALPFPPPPQPLEPAYDSPQLQRLSPRPPLPSLPTGPRFVPLHPVPPAPPSLGKGKGRMTGEDLTAEEEKRAIARARGLDDLLEREREEEDAVALLSPATTDLPTYPAASQMGLQRHASTSKRLLTSLPEKGERENEKALAAVEEVRRLANEDSARQVEADMTSSKARLAREADEEERARLAQSRAAEAVALEKRMEEQLRLEDIDGMDDPPPPITPDDERGGMLPLTDTKKRLDEPAEVRGTTPVAPPSSSYRLPPPPVAILAQPAYPSTTSLTRHPEPQHQMRPPLHPAPTAPPASLAPHATAMEPPRSATLLASSHESSAVSFATGRLPSMLAASEPLSAPPLPRHRSLGPAASFYSTGLGLADPTRSSTLTASVRQRQSSMIVSEPSLRHESLAMADDAPTAAHQRGLSWSDTSALPHPASFAMPPTSSISAHLPAAPVTQALPPASTISEFGAVQLPHRSPSTTPTLVHHPAQPTAAPSPPALAFQSVQQATPAFYTAVTPGGPLLPFYASASTSPGGPTSYFTPLGATALPPDRMHAASLPPPPAQQVFASLPPPPQPVTFPSLAPPPHHLHPVASPPLLHPHRSASVHDLRPSSRSSSISPSLLGERTSSKPGRATRMSTIRNLFGKKGGSGAGLAEMPEE